MNPNSAPERDTPNSEKNASSEPLWPDAPAPFNPTSAPRPLPAVIQRNDVRRPVQRRGFINQLLSLLMITVGVLALIAAIYYVRSRVGGSLPSRVAQMIQGTPTPTKMVFATAVPTQAAVTVPTMAAHTATATAEDVAEANAVATETPPPFVAKVASDAPADTANPLFGSNYDPNDGKPVFICGMDAYPGFLTLLQMQVQGIDVANGFHLGIVPIELDEKAYALDEEAYNRLIRTGAWDCLLERVDENAELNLGVITALVDESVGGNGIWARGVLSNSIGLDGLKGKRLGFVEDTSSQFFAKYALGIAPPEVSGTVSLEEFKTVDQAIEAFNLGKIDAVSAWEPHLSRTKANGGAPLITTQQLRVVVNAIITSRKAIAEKAELVQAFHNAWFDTLRAQFADLDGAAASIAAWGHNDWTGIAPTQAALDLRVQMSQLAQASLENNVSLARDNTPILSFVETARKLWASSDAITDTTTSQNSEFAEPTPQELIDLRFVPPAAARPSAQTDKRPLNDSFSLIGASALTETAASIAATPALTNTPGTTLTTGLTATAATTTTSDLTALGVLPCRKFTFLPDSAVLTEDSKKVLDICAVPLLQQRAAVYLRIKGSAAWPGPQGTYSQTQIIEIARARARSIADYLVSKGISATRFLVEGSLPPQDHWETLDGLKQAEDRFVELTLIVGGR